MICRRVEQPKACRAASVPVVSKHPMKARPWPHCLLGSPRFRACLHALTAWGLVAAAAASLRADVVEADGKVHVTYWEKWTGFEKDALQRTVDRFNASQDRIVVTIFTTSQIDRKTIIATAGGDPPDIAGLWQQNIASFADAEALMPLDDFIRRDGSTPEAWLERYYPVYAGMGRHAGRVYAAISTPAMVALHWNRTLFREAGLDPDQPPRTLAELSEFSRRLTKRDPATGELTQVGFLPQEPGWWPWAFPLWFGGELVADNAISLGTDPANRRAFEWVAEISRELGSTGLQRFAAGFGNPSAPESAFIVGKVAMTVQGVWFHNYIEQFRPGLDYAIGAWPQVPGGPANFSIGLADVLVIPRGAKNPEAAWAFIRYLAQANPDATTRDELEGAELLSYLQKKNSPLRTWSPFFTTHHPHPFIGMFRELSADPEATTHPDIGMWQAYEREILSVFERTRLLDTTPGAALDYAQDRMQDEWTRYQRSLRRHGQLPRETPSDIQP